MNDPDEIIFAHRREINSECDLPADAASVMLLVSDAECESIGREVCRQSFAPLTAAQYSELGRRFLSTVGGWYLFLLNRTREVTGTANAKHAATSSPTSNTTPRGNKRNAAETTDINTEAGVSYLIN